MPRSFITARHDALYREAVEGLLGDLGKKVRFEIIPADVAATYCTNCVWDPVHNCSSGRYNNNGPKPFSGKTCPVCKGVGKITTSGLVRIPEAIVRYGKVMPGDGKQFTPQGELPLGYARVRCRKRYLATAQAAQAFLLDGVRYSLVGEIRKRGLKTDVAIEMVLKRDD